MKIDYSSVDWSRHDAAIACDLGITRAAVGKARRKAGAPPSQAPVKTKPLSQRAWIERAQSLLLDLGQWELMAGEDLEAEFDFVGKIFNEASNLRKLKP